MVWRIRSLLLCRKADYKEAIFARGTWSHRNRKVVQKGKSLRALNVRQGLLTFTFTFVFASQICTLPHGRLTRALRVIYTYTGATMVAN